MSDASIYRRLVLHSAVALALVGVLASSSHAALVNKVSNFQSTSTPSNSTTKDRWFQSTGFENTTQVWDTSNLGFFADGRLTWTQGGSSVDYGWTDAIPIDAGSTNSFPLNPDRGDDATPFAGEANTPKTGTLREVFGQSNLAYLLDGEDNSLAWTLNLFYEAGKAVVNDGDQNTMELLMLERGMNSKLGVRAILNGGAFSSDVILDFTASGFAGYELNTLEIGSAQRVGGFGVDLNAFGLAQGALVIGYQFFSDGSPNFNGPDLIGFVGSVAPQPIPEPSTVVLAGVGGLVLAFRSIRKRVSARRDRSA